MAWQFRFLRDTKVSNIQLYLPAVGDREEKSNDDVLSKRFLRSEITIPSAFCAGTLSHNRLFMPAIDSNFADTAADSARQIEEAASRKGEEFPLSSVQEVIWLDQALHPDIPFCNIGLAFKIDNALDAQLLRVAVNLVANAHDALRLELCGAYAVARQRIVPTVDVPLEIIDFSAHADAHDRAFAHVRQAFSRPFNPLTGLLWEVQLVRWHPTRYYFLNRYHHLVTDGLGVSLIGWAISETYNRLLTGDTAPVIPGPSYREFIAEDQSYLASARFERDREFWTNRFANLPPALLPSAGGNTLGSVSPSKQFRWTIARSLFDRLADFASENGLTLVHVMLGVLAAYFARVNGAEEVVIGVPVHNRGSARSKITFGMFSSVNPIGIFVNPDDSFVDLMRAIAAELKRCYRHQRFPIAELNRKLKLGQTGRKQLFDISLSFESLNGNVHFGGSPIEVIAMDHGFEQTPLAVFIRDYDPGGDVVVDFNYNTMAFGHEEVEQIQARISHLLTRIADHGQTPVSRLPLMEDTEKRRLLVDFNATAVDYPRDRLIHELFEARAVAHPHAVAVADEAQTISFDQLNRRANHLAHRLIAMGVGPDRRVAVCLERSIDMVIALVAILKAGGAYVPLDPAYPAERLAYMLQDSAPVALLTWTTLESLLPGVTIPVIELDAADTLASLAQQPHGNPKASDLGLAPHHLAYVIYTSGSTGMPKGVMNQHDGVVNRLLWAQETYRLDASDHVLQKTPFGFDVSVWEFFLPLLAGARLVMARPGGHQDPGYLARTIAQEGITTLHFVPSMLQVFLDQADLAGCASLRRVLCSGEALPYPLQLRFHALLPHAELHNLYGPTEAAIDVTALRCQPGVYDGVVPIGRPIANIRIYILDGQLQPVPLGASGEIHIGGVGVARGYLNRPDLSAERFVDDPFAAHPATMYKTGDLGRWLPDGTIEYLGRNDFQVKLRGLRIELGEIEARLTACAGVRDAVVVAREDVPGDKRLVAYLLASEGATLVAGELRTTLAETLADYMLPSAFVVLDTFPLTPNGKLDRRALPVPDQSAIVTRGYAAPQGEVEIAIALVWQQLLGVERVGRHDDFFDLGGHSLLALQVIARLRHDLNVELAIHDLFRQPTVSALAGLIERSDKRMTLALSSADRSKPLPLSFAQQRLWFLSQLNPAASVASHMPAALRLHGALDVDALRSALDRIVMRHENLRTTFVQIDGTPSQVVAPADSGFALQRTDLRGMPRADQDSRVAAISHDEVHLAFDLSAGPLIRGQLLQLGEHEHVLLLTMHHIISDGWSIGIFIDELRVLYTAFRQGQADPLPPLSVQYGDYAAWQAHWLQGDAYKAQADFWVRQLAGAPMLLDLPTDRPRPQVQSYAGASIDVALSEELTGALRRLARDTGTTPFMILLAAWSVLMARLSGQNDVVVGTSVANRQRTEVESLIGFFVNSLALRVRIDDDPTVAELLAQIKETTLDAYAHQDLPFEQVIEAVAPPRSLSHSSIFQVMLILDNTPGGAAVSLPDISISPAAVVRPKTHFDLTLSLADAGSALTGKLEYATDLFDAATVARLAGSFVTLLGAMVADDGQRVRRLPVLGAQERQQLLQAWNATDVAFPLEEGYAALFAERVACFPERRAAVCAGRALTYRELDLRSNRLAHALVAAGAGPDTIVALMGERDLPLLVMMVAVLKAGAAFLPLDVHHPVERLREVLVSSRAPLVLVAQEATSLFDDVTAAMADVPQALVTEQLWLDGIADALPPRSGGGDLAYVIFTSGSTGKPKGALVEQRGMLNNMLGKIPTVGLGPDDRVAQTASPAFDISVWQFLAAPLVGATIHILPDAVVHDPLRLIDAIEDAEVTLLEIVPSLMRAMLDLCASGPALASLRWVLPTGEALPLKVAQDWFGRFPHVPLMNVYGPAECADDVAFHAITARPADDDVIPIGRPTPNNRLYIVDDQLQPVPVGVAGEICVAGTGVGRGYLHDPVQTAAVFIDHPFAPGERFYRTGDIGRYRADGTIEFVGRRDHQVKIRGFRIELGEIEAQLAACEGVVDALVVAREDVPGDKRLVAYLTTDGSAPVAPAALRQQLSAALPDYMVPGAFVTLDAFPLSPNGKVDRRALPAPDQAAVVTRRYEAPQGDLEHALAAIWQELLGLERVGRHDNFFELGGHSMMIVALIERLRQQGKRADVRIAFSAPTLSEMARAIAQEDAGETGTVVPPNLIAPDCTAITPEMLTLVSLSSEHIDTIAARVPGGVSNIQDIYPLVPLQEGILFHHLLQKDGDAYLLRSVIAFDGREQLDACLAAIQTVIDRHDILRTAFQWEGLPQPVQIVHRSAMLPVEAIVLTDVQAPRQQLLDYTDARHRRLSLQHAPLLAAYTAIDPQTGQHLLALLIHHMVCDHVTMELLLAEARLILAGQAHALAPSLPYRNFIAQALAAPVGAHEAYFRQQLGDVEEPSAPFDVFNVQGDGSQVREAIVDLSDESARRIRDNARRHQVGPSVLFHVAWAQVVAQCSGRHDVVFGTVLSGRLQGVASADRVLGLFINTLPVRIDLQDLDVGQALAAMKAQLAGLLAHEQAPLSLALRCSGVPASAPLFTTLLNYHHSNRDTTAERADGVGAGMHILSVDEYTNYPIDISIDDLGQGFSLIVHGAGGLDPARIARYMATAVDALLDALETAPHRAVRSLDILPAPERRQLLVDFNPSACAPAPNGLIHALFEVQAATRPHAGALVHGDEACSYGQLNGRANQLAHRLIGLGVGPDARVAICVERGIDMIVGLLAILKAGGAYVPLDPTYPRERLAHMFQDSAARVLLTQAALQPLLPAPGIPAIVLDAEADRAMLARQDDGNPDLRAAGLTPQHLAYVMYTSGSTGTPKGVMVTHQNVVRLVKDTNYVALNEQSIIAQASNTSFDAATFEIWGALLNGGKLVHMDKACLLSPALLAAQLRRDRIGVQFVTTALFNRVAMEVPDCFGSLDTLLFGGEAVSHAAVESIVRHGMPARLLHVYGPTENTTFSTYFQVNPAHMAASTVVPIGAALAGTTLYVLDEARQPVPPGVTGELYVGGLGVARGYLNRPDLTANLFVSNPFSADPGDRLYRTGDRVRWLDDGNIDYVGRTDFQVKMRGFRIEPGEIEAKLAQYAGVRSALVIVQEDAGDKRLVAYLLADDGVSLSAPDLRNHLAATLADHMIPGAFITLDAFPLTPNGKIDRKALPVPTPSAASAADYAAPQGDTETSLARIWQQLLGLERVGRHDHFFELGGHSLVIVNLIGRLREHGLSIDAGTVFASPTLEAMASAITPHTPGDNVAQVPANLIPDHFGRSGPTTTIEEILI